jgi:Phage-related protein
MADISTNTLLNYSQAMNKVQASASQLTTTLGKIEATNQKMAQSSMVATAAMKNGYDAVTESIKRTQTEMEKLSKPIRLSIDCSSLMSSVQRCLESASFKIRCECVGGSGNVSKSESKSSSESSSSSEGTGEVIEKAGIESVISYGLENHLIPALGTSLGSAGAIGGGLAAGGLAMLHWAPQVSNALFGWMTPNDTPQQHAARMANEQDLSNRLSQGWSQLTSNPLGYITSTFQSGPDPNSPGMQALFGNNYSLKSGLQWMGGGITSNLGNAGNWIRGAAGNTANWLGSGLNQVATAPSTITSNIARTLGGIHLPTLTLPKINVSGITSAIHGAISQATGLWNGFRHLIGAGVHGAVNIGTAALKVAQNLGHTVYGYIRAGASGILHVATGALQNAWSLGTRVYNYIRGGASGVAKVVGDGISAVWSAVNNLYDTVRRGASGVVSIVQHLLGGPGAALPRGPATSLSGAYGVRYESYGGSKKPINETLSCLSGNCVDLTLGQLTLAKAFGIPAEMVMTTWNGNPHVYGRINGIDRDVANHALTGSWSRPPAGPSSSNFDDNRKIELHFHDKVYGMNDFDKQVEKSVNRLVPGGAF